MDSNLPVKPQDFGEIAAAVVLELQKKEFDATSVELQGKNAPFDIHIYKKNNLVGLCQVKTSIDEIYEAREAEFRKKFGRIMPLSAGMGVWTVEISEKIKLKKTLPQIQNFLYQLEEKNIARWQPWLNQIHASAEISELGTCLGITSANKLHNSQGDYFFVSPRITFGIITAEPIGLSEWITNLIDKHLNSFIGLKESGVIHKHLFFWMGTSTPDNLILSANFNPMVLPSERLSIPDWVTEVWIGLPFLDETSTLYIWKYSSSLGWRLREITNWPAHIAKYP